MSKTKALALDYDGVIIDSLDANLEAANIALETLEHPTPLTRQDMEECETMTFEALAAHVGLGPSKLPRFLELTVEEIASHIMTCEIFPEILKSIDLLSQRCHLAIVSANEEAVVCESLKAAGLGEYFTHILAGETRPKAQKLKELAYDLKLSRKNVYMVGDCVSDIRQAKAAKVKSVAATWGYHTRQRLMAETPDYLIDTPEQLLAIIDGQCPHWECCGCL